MAGGCFEDGDGRWRWTWQEESGNACIRRSATLTRCTTLLGVCLRGAMNQACILRVCVCVCVCVRVVFRFLPSGPEERCRIQYGIH